MAEGSSWRPPRPCEAYRAEWNLCRSARHFLHNYYVHGERPACEQWRRDLDSCREWEERRSAEAQVGLVHNPKDGDWSTHSSEYVGASAWLGTWSPTYPALLAHPSPVFRVPHCFYALEDNFAHCTASRKPDTIANCCEQPGWAGPCSTLAITAQEMAVLRILCVHMGQ
ncbi:UPF0545 protein C22orf39 homolog isoform X1 [Rhinolophus ferrumequinum]|uniref:UPF0545 protein C22orf39 homolog isoform X1 n=1 Tax=Rhinolophus ferrumequinum TaxID=59479 RepID=UPI00140FA7FB|nr:UPF0545 protein C22orf39 homolog isoform X1 [Rhinolophus ferrumequinum]